MPELTVGQAIAKVGSAKSSTWGTKEAEIAGRARINESQIRKYTMHNEARFENHKVSAEDMEADAAAAKKRKLQQDNELSGFLEAQQQNDSAKKGLGNMMKPVKAKEEAAKSKLPGFLAVKKQKAVSDDKAVASAADAAPSAPDASGSTAQAATGGIGLGGYGSSSEESDGDDGEKLPSAAL
eukprot:TRINITY_DN7845_c0_g1_i1.p1 TRINITY_DN7845_c0_g1~~TRINITY_DN7845_c0_g1_i1.p1  ORF type:complete len:182 (-),score=56.26 TRINITY_DN7845_c0_g1_i1:95-640(-)